MKKKRNDSEEELDIDNIPRLDFFMDFLETIRDSCPPEEQRKIIRLFKEKQRRLRENHDKFLQELIQSKS